MDLSKILAIAGKPGLYQLLSQTKTGFIVESLADGKRFPVFSHERVSSLGEISIFSTEKDDLPLRQVFRQMFEATSGQPGPEAGGDANAIRKFFTESVPTFDPERVYISDMKKAIGWFNLLLAKDMLDFSEEATPEEDSGTKEEPSTNGESHEKD
jgi:hypothetical protein